VPDRLGRDAQVRIVRVAQRLRNERDDLPLDAYTGEGVLKRLLDHVAHPPRRRRDQHAQRQRLHLVGGELVARQLVAHLRAVAVHQGDRPPLARQVHDRRQALARVPELVRDGGPLPRRCDCVPAHRHDDRPGPHGGAT